MPRKPLKIRRAMLVATLAMLAVVLAAWGVSWMSYVVIERNRHELRSANDFERGDHRAAVWRSKSSLTFVAGEVNVVWGAPETYSMGKEAWSLASSRDGWSASWRWFRLVYPYERAPFSWNGPLDWSVPGASLDVSDGVWYPRAQISVSIWTVQAALAVIAVVLWLPIRRWSKRLANNQCPRCGYDRKGLASAAACPECGETPAPAPPAA